MTLPQTTPGDTNPPTLTLKQADALLFQETDSPLQFDAKDRFTFGDVSYTVKGTGKSADGRLEIEKHDKRQSRKGVILMTPDEFQTELDSHSPVKLREQVDELKAQVAELNDRLRRLTAVNQAQSTQIKALLKRAQELEANPAPALPTIECKLLYLPIEHARPDMIDRVAAAIAKARNEGWQVCREAPHESKGSEFYLVRFERVVSKVTAMPKSEPALEERAV